jgi:hypothetical protein
VLDAFEAGHVVLAHVFQRGSMPSFSAGQVVDHGNAGVTGNSAGSGDTVMLGAMLIAVLAVLNVLDGVAFRRRLRCLVVSELARGLLGELEAVVRRLVTNGASWRLDRWSSWCLGGLDGRACQWKAG